VERRKKGETGEREQVREKENQILVYLYKFMESLEEVIEHV
jgi:hypothetical protein